MYAVIQTGGKQYTVTPKQTLQIDKLAQAEGEMVTFPVLSFKPGEEAALQIGKPILSDTTVKAVVKEHVKDDKIKIVKFRRRKHYQKQMGHRQKYTVVTIQEIGGLS